MDPAADVIDGGGPDCLMDNEGLAEGAEREGVELAHPAAKHISARPTDHDTETEDVPGLIRIMDLHGGSMDRGP